jgi:hypothetical protein
LLAINSPLAALEEQPTSFTQFGQALETELQKPLKAHLAPRPDVPPLIDVVDPFQPLDAADAPQGDPAPMPDQARVWPAPLLIEPVLESARAGLPGADAASSRLAIGERSMAPSRFRALLGVATLAAGGYHVAMRESERFKVRWLPRRAVSDRSVRPRIPAR